MKHTALILLVLVAAVAVLSWGQSPYPPQGYPTQGYPQQGYPQQNPGNSGPGGQPADSGPTYDNGQDPGQGRGVARISVMNGEVSVRRGDSGEMVAAALNAPVAALDQVLTGPGSRAEIQLDFANFIRMNADTEVRLSELDPQRYQVQIAHGMVTFRVLRNTNADIDISTPQLSVRPLGVGTYRVTVHDDGTSEIVVRTGEVDIFTPRGSERLRAGQTMLARGTVSEPEVQVVGPLQRDEWDAWGESRDRQLLGSRSYQYVPQDVYGAEDLDGHGQWTYDQPYGWVWAPQVAPDWAPYRNGQWTWMDYYGWTWVSYDPWGWAPYHYGRWYHGRLGWCWYPGVPYGRHYWSPAMVAFFGFGGGGIGFGFGNVGWVPLAPYERLHPWWGPGYYGGFHNGNYFRNVAIANNVNVYNSYRNGRFGASGLAASSFGQMHGNPARLNGSDLQRAGLMRGALPMAPGRDSLRLGTRAVQPAAFQRATMNDNTRFFGRQQPSQVQRVPFAQQQSSVSQAARNTFGSSAVPAPYRGGLSSGSPGGFSRQPQAVQPVQPRSDPGSSWRRFGEPNRPAAAAARSVQPSASQPASGNNGSSWGRFGGGNNNNYQRSAPAPRTSAPQSYGRQGGGEPVRISPPIVRERPAAPSQPRYSAPSQQPRYSAPSQQPRYSAPSQPHYSAPSQPHYSAPSRGNSGGGGGGGGSHGSSNSGGSHGGRR